MANTKTVFPNLAIPLFSLFISTFSEFTGVHGNILCIKEERVALLNIKKSLNDTFGCLSSWVGEDCCKWKGVGCNNQTGHVVELDLNSYSICNKSITESSSWSTLGGELSPSLVDLKHLSYLDLSYNDFQGIPIPYFLGNLSMLHYLDLSNAKFSGMIPSHLGNLSNLYHLSLSCIVSNPYALYVSDLRWLSGHTSLQYLNMESVDMSKVSDEWLYNVNIIPSLLELHLSYCKLRTFPQPLPLVNFTSLSILDLSYNDFNSSIPQWLFNISTLVNLRVTDSGLRGPLPQVGWRNLCKLQILGLSDNELTVEVNEVIMALSSCNKSLEELDLSSNHLSGHLPEHLGHFHYLKDLSFPSNSISGPIPLSIGNLSNLESLDLFDNKMNGTIPERIGQLSKLFSLDLTGNSWEGTITNLHFQNLTNLLEFSISCAKNTLDLFKMTHDWTPPFDLSSVGIIDCQIGPTFPSWLETQKELEYVLLTNVGILEAIPDWLWKLSPQILILDLSHNKINGYLPKPLNFPFSIVNLAFNQLEGPIALLHGVTELGLRNNSLSGPIPTNYFQEMTSLYSLDLSNNLLNGSIPSSITNQQGLILLDLSYNQLTGEIPINWIRMKATVSIDLSHNNLSGGIPTSICSIPSLNLLQLSNNNLHQDLSSAFQNCTGLITLDLGNNRFFGSIPQEVGTSLALISVLRLRGNTLTGTIPESLCNLPNLHLLDLAGNNLWGTIPACLGDVLGLKLPSSTTTKLPGVAYQEHIDLVLKGKQDEYFQLMRLVNIIDLSKNRFSGGIPPKLTELLHLGTLNLSWNRLTGNIPKNMGSLRYLETLDLSHNHLSGPIPPSMSSMTFLSHLNLSNNNLSGQIPSTNQFLTFNDPSSYEGNPNLCGTPLSNCSSPNVGHADEEGEDEDEEKFNKFWFYVGTGFGFIVGFWTVFGSLVIKRSWRHAYFKFLDSIKNKLWG